MVLEGRVAIVTGSAGGIGQAFAVGLAKEGAAVGIADIADTSRTVEMIEAVGGRALGVPCDVTCAQSVSRAVALITERFAQVDILVNNAAIFPGAPVEQMSSEDWDRVFAVNVRGVFEMVKAVLPSMRASRRGKIINISSALIFAGDPMMCAYTASKSALVGFSRSLARAAGPDNIQVNVITPGIVPGTPGLLDLGLPPAAIDHVVSGQCIARPETPQDLIGALIFLASGQSDFITGQILNVDGGSAMI